MDLSRRKIIKSLALVAGATATGLIPGSSMLMAASPALIDVENDFGKRKLNAVLIGAGKRGMHFAEHALKQNHALKIVGIAEPKQLRRETASDLLNIEKQYCYTHWNKILEVPKLGDVAIIAASQNYFEVCNAALQAGYHVWVDRPASMDYDEIISLNYIAAKQKRSLLYCYIDKGNFQFMSHRNFEKKPKELFV